MPDIRANPGGDTSQCSIEVYLCNPGIYKASFIQTVHTRFNGLLKDVYFAEIRIYKRRKKCLKIS